MKKYFKNILSFNPILSNRIQFTYTYSLIYTKKFISKIFHQKYLKQVLFKETN